MNNMPEYKKFVIHKHTRGNDIHWDLMIEWGEVLKTWRLDNPPEKLNSEKTKATPIQDHDKKFLTYQGPVNNGTGTAEIVDEGYCEIILNNTNTLKIYFDGEVLKGNIAFDQEKSKN